MLDPSSYLKTIYERILQRKTSSGKTSYKSSQRNYTVKVVKGKPVEVVKIKKTPLSKHVSQKLFKSPGTIRKAVQKMKVTRAIRKARGLYRKRLPGGKTPSDVVKHIEQKKKSEKGIKQARIKGYARRGLESPFKKKRK